MFFFLKNKYNTETIKSKGTKYIIKEAYNSQVYNSFYSSINKNFKDKKITVYKI